MPATHVFVAVIARKLGLHANDLFVLQASMCFDCLQTLSFSWPMASTFGHFRNNGHCTSRKTKSERSSLRSACNIITIPDIAMFIMSPDHMVFGPNEFPYIVCNVGTCVSSSSA